MLGYVALASLACACRKEVTAEAIERAPDAIAEQGPSGTSTWVVRPDGAVSATLKTPDGKPVSEPVTGQLAFASAQGAPVSVPVQYDAKTGVLTAAGPKLEADITPVTFSLTAGGAPWSGSIDVPPGGTQELVDTGKLQPPAMPGAVGPNGGVVQIVGPDCVELVANRHTGDLRAYVLDADNHPVDPGDRRITVAFQGEPQVLALTPEPQAHFVVGRLPALVDPPEFTVAVHTGPTTHACLVGWAPGAVVVVRPDAPRIHLLAVDAWPGEGVEVRGPHGMHRGEVVVGAPGIAVGAPGIGFNAPGVVVNAPGVVVGAPGVVVGAPGAVVVGPPGLGIGPPPGVVVGGPRAVVGGPGFAVGATVHGPGVGWGHAHEHGHGH